MVDASTSLKVEKKVQVKPEKTLKLAFIGTGGISRTHMNAFKDMPDVEIVAACDIDKETLEDWCEAFDLDIPTYTKYQDMLKKVKGIDAIDICTPNGVHAPAAIASSKAGCHVITEKPMAMNGNECKKMIAAAKAAKKKLVIGFQYRYDPKTEFLCTLRDEDVFGDIKFTRVQALRRRGIPNWGVFGQKHLQGGGPMIDIGVHVIEMAHFTMGAPKPVAATGLADTYMGNDKEAAQIKTSWSGWDWKTYTVEDLAIGSVRFDNGAVMHIEASFAAHHEHDGTMDFQIMGTKGGAKWGSSEVFTDQHGYMMNMKPNFVDKGGFGQFFPAKLRNFVDHCLYKKPTMAPAEHGLMVQQIIDGVYASAAKGGKEVLIK